MLTRTWLLLVAFASGVPSLTQQTASDSQCQQPAVAVVRPKCHFHTCESADKKMNRAYRAVHKKLDKRSAQRLRSAQRDWRKSRDANCELESALCDGGTAAVRYQACREAMTRQRTRELRAIYQRLAGAD